MNPERKPILDYSSPAEEKQRERSEEDARREGIERYNESTYGERRPAWAVLMRFLTLVAVGALLAGLLPRRLFGIAVVVMAIAYVLWEWKRSGWDMAYWQSWKRRGGE